MIKWSIWVRNTNQSQQIWLNFVGLFSPLLTLFSVANYNKFRLRIARKQRPKKKCEKLLLSYQFDFKHRKMKHIFIACLLRSFSLSKTQIHADDRYLNAICNIYNRIELGMKWLMIQSKWHWAKDLRLIKHRFQLAIYLPAQNGWKMRVCAQIEQKKRFHRINAPPLKRCTFDPSPDNANKRTARNIPACWVERTEK